MTEESNLVKTRSKWVKRLWVSLAIGSALGSLLALYVTLIIWPGMQYVDCMNLAPITPELEAQGVARVPRIIHQTWKDNSTIPIGWQKGQRRWERSTTENLWPFGKEYKYMFWTDASSREFIANDFPWFLQSYDAYPYPIQRVDAVRLFWLYKFGGIYVDLDISRRSHKRCGHSLDEWRRFGFVAPSTQPLGMSNDFMMAEPGHPFVAHLIQRLSSSDHWWYGTKYWRVLLSTGPLFLTTQYLMNPSFLSQVHLLPDHCYRTGDNCFLGHRTGSSWHGDDAKYYRFLWDNIYLVVFVVLTLISIFLSRYQSLSFFRRTASRIKNS